MFPYVGKHLPKPFKYIRQSVEFISSGNLSADSDLLHSCLVALCGITARVESSSIIVLRTPLLPLLFRTPVSGLSICFLGSLFVLMIHILQELHEKEYWRPFLSPFLHLFLISIFILKHRNVHNICTYGLAYSDNANIQVTAVLKTHGHSFSLLKSNY